MSRASEWAFRTLARIIDSQRRHRVSQFEVLPRASHPVVMLGDSITEQGIWEEWFPGVRIANRGVGGDTAAQLLDRLDSAALTADARKVFILIGTNDLSQGVPEDVIVANLTAIVREVTARAPAAGVYLQSVMPRKKVYRDRLARLNDRYRAVARSLGVEYVDLWPALATPDGALSPEYSLDDLHLNGRGYEAWIEILRPIVGDAAPR